MGTDSNTEFFSSIERVFDHKQVEVLFFDIFDTIILRKVHPEYVKKIFSKKLKEYFNIEISSEKLYGFRFEIEASLCKENERKGFDLEFRFEDFCRSLFAKLQKKHLLPKDLSYEYFYRKCYEFELASELATQIIDEKIVDIAKKAKEQEVEVYCLSDFYLSKEMLLELFRMHQIDHLFKDIFVSSEFLLTKRSGRLYKKIISEKFPKKKIAMIGDNEHSDILMAQENGLEALLIDRKEQRAFYQAHKNEVLSQKDFHKKILDILNQPYGKPGKIYFKEMAFTLFYFVYRLYLEAVTHQTKHIFFLSREGEFLKKIFDTFLETNNISTIQTHYLIVSRKATFIASLDKLEDESFDTLFRQYRKMSLQTFLKSLNFFNNEIASLSADMRVDFNAVQEDLPTSELFSALLQNNLFQKMYENKRMIQKENLRKYIESFGADIYGKGMTIVDAGWKGTIQDHLFKVFDQKVQLNGYYIGLVTDLMADSLNRKKGLVFDYQNGDRYDKVFQENMAIFEVLLGASHGSADHYVCKDEKVIAVTHMEKEEEQIFSKVVAPIQDVLFTVFRKIAEAFMLSHVSVLDMREEVAQIHARMIYSPAPEEIGFFRQLYHFENFGLFEYSTFDKYKTSDKKEQLKHILNFVKNPKKFLEATFWKAAALDDIGLLSVYLLYGKLQKIKIFGITEANRGQL